MRSNILLLVLCLCVFVVTCTKVKRCFADSEAILQFNSVRGYAPFLNPGTPNDQAANLEGAKLYRQGVIEAESGDWEAAVATFAKCSKYAGPNGLIDIQVARHAFGLGEFSVALAKYEDSAYWSNGHLQGMEMEDAMNYAYLLMWSGQSGKARQAYSDTYPLITSQGLFDDSPQTPLPSFSPQSPPSLAEFKSAAMTAAGLISAAKALGGPPTLYDSQLGLPKDNSWQTYHERIAIENLNSAVSLMPSSPYPYYYLGKYYKHVPGREADSAEAFHKAWENGDSDMEQRVLNETKFASPEFQKAFQTRFTDTKLNGTGVLK